MYSMSNSPGAAISSAFQALRAPAPFVSFHPTEERFALLGHPGVASEGPGEHRWARLAEAREPSDPAGAMGVYLRLVESTLTKADKRAYWSLHATSRTLDARRAPPSCPRSSTTT